MDITDDIIEKAKKVAERHVCDRCLGRQFAKVGTGMTNDVRGALIREKLKDNGFESTADHIQLSSLINQRFQNHH